MSYINSNNIKVYPCVSRDRDNGIDPEANLPTENNLTQVIRSIYKRDSFLISDSANVNNFEFVLGGYYFKIDTTDTNWTNLGDTIWAGIKLKNDPTSSYQALVIDNNKNTGETSSDYYSCTDVDGSFEGLYLSTTEPSGYTYTLQLLADGEIPATSKLYWITENILDDSITTPKVVDQNITTEKIKDLSVTNEKLGENSVTSEKIKDGEVKTDDIADLNVTTEKLAKAAVTTEKLNDSSVTTAKVSASAITTEKINNSSVTTEKLADEAITTDKLGIKAYGGLEMYVEDETLVLNYTEVTFINK